MTKVIFLQNVEDYKVGDVKEVSEGYARNFLFKRGFAEVASEEKMKEIEGKLSKIKKEESENVAKVNKIAEKLKNTKIELIEEVNEEGQLYGSVGVKEIADAINEEKFEIDGSAIEIEEPIKALGVHEINVKLGHGVEVKINITVNRKK